MDSFDYSEYIDSLMEFIAGKRDIRPFPGIEFVDEDQDGDVVFSKTAYYSPDRKTVTLFIKDRHPKDVLRSLAHELIHHSQNLGGRLRPSDYSGETITDDDRLMELEKEAYLNGNILFRSWTEDRQKEAKSRKKKDSSGKKKDNPGKGVKITEAQLRGIASAIYGKEKA